MARCGCAHASECGCNLGADDGLVVTGAGSPASPWLVGILLDPDSENGAEVSPSGLLVPKASPLETQILENTAATVAIGSGATVDVFTSTITLPTGWLTMDVTVLGWVRFTATGSGHMRFTLEVSSPSGTLINSSGLSIICGSGGIATAGMNNIVAYLAGLSANRTFRYRVINTRFEATSVDVIDRYVIAQKTRLS